MVVFDSSVSSLATRSLLRDFALAPAADPTTPVIANNPSRSEHSVPLRQDLRRRGHRGDRRSASGALHHAERGQYTNAGIQFRAAIAEMLFQRKACTAGRLEDTSCRATTPPSAPIHDQLLHRTGNRRLRCAWTPRPQCPFPTVRLSASGQRGGSQRSCREPEMAGSLNLLHDRRLVRCEGLAAASPAIGGRFDMGKPPLIAGRTRPARMPMSARIGLAWYFKGLEG